MGNCGVVFVWDEGREGWGREEVRGGDCEDDGKSGRR